MNVRPYEFWTINSHKEILNCFLVECFSFFVVQDYAKVEHVPGLTGPARPSIPTVTQILMN